MYQITLLDLGLRDEIMDEINVGVSADLDTAKRWCRIREYGLDLTWHEVNDDGPLGQWVTGPFDQLSNRWMYTIDEIVPIDADQCQREEEYQRLNPAVTDRDRLMARYA